MRMSQMKKIVFGAVAVLTVFYLSESFRKTFQDGHNEELLNNAGHKIHGEPKDSENNRAREEDDIDMDKLTLKNEMRIFEDNGLPAEQKMSQIDGLRQKRLEKECSRRGQNDDILDSNDFRKYPRLPMLVSDNQKIMFCFTGDPYNEMWKTILGGTDMRSLYSYRGESITYRLKFYYKFLVVQQPLVRFLTAYKSWLAPIHEGQNYFDDKKLYQEMERISDRIQREGFRSSNSSKDAAFSDFVSFVVKQVHSEEALHPLWERINVLCQPCSMNYDYISRAETGLEDFKYLLSRFDKTPADQYKMTYKASSDLELLEEIHKNLPSELLENIFEAFETDHELFGYPKPWE